MLVFIPLLSLHTAVVDAYGTQADVAMYASLAMFIVFVYKVSAFVAAVTPACGQVSLAMFFVFVYKSVRLLQR
jgi:hypothetical protein